MTTPAFGSPIKGRPPTSPSGVSDPEPASRAIRQDQLNRAMALRHAVSYYQTRYGTESTRYDFNETMVLETAARFTAFIEDGSR